MLRIDVDDDHLAGMKWTASHIVGITTLIAGCDDEGTDLQSPLEQESPYHPLEAFRGERLPLELEHPIITRITAPHHIDRHQHRGLGGCLRLLETGDLIGSLDGSLGEEGVGPRNHLDATFSQGICNPQGESGGNLDSIDFSLSEQVQHDSLERHRFAIGLTSALFHLGVRDHFIDP